MEIFQRTPSHPTSRRRLVVTFVLELTAVVSLSVLEILLRATDVFPVRAVSFNTSDLAIRCSSAFGRYSMEDFAFNADVSYALVVALSFCIPPCLMLACEMIRAAVAEDRVLRASTLCVVCDIHVLTRRVIRFVGTFLAGILVTMIFVDVTKLMTGRPRPVFLEVCVPNVTTCVGGTCSIDACTQIDTGYVRWARLAFPSFHAAITAYSACFMAVYCESMLTNGLRCRVFGPFVAMTAVISSLMCGLSRYALFYSHWTDVAVGFGIGVVIGIYVSAFVLNNFNENTEVRGQRLGRTVNAGLPNDHPARRVRRKGSKLPWYWTTWNWNMQENLNRENIPMEDARDEDRASGSVRSSHHDTYTSRDRLVDDNLYTYY